MTTPKLHPAVLEKLSWFETSHLTDPDIRRLVEKYQRLAEDTVEHTGGEGPQLTLALQHLIDAKDCAVRALVARLRTAGNPPTHNRQDLRPPHTD